MSNLLRVTQRDVAQKYGCSHATVSLALSGNPRISEKVRAEIMQLAEKMGYRPDPSLAQLARSRFARRTSDYRANLAYLVHSKATGAMQLRHLDAARRRAEQSGYKVESFDLANYASGSSAAQVLYNRGVRGIIIPSMPALVEDYLRDHAWERFTIVCCSLGWARFVYNVVTDDVFAATRLAWSEVISRGYKRIGAAMFRHNPIAEDDYTRHGASVAQQEALVPKNRRIPILVDCDPLDRDTFIRWFERHRPEVVLSFISRACEWLVDSGYRVPEDVAFTCLNVRPQERYTGVLIPDPDLATTAVDFLISQIHQNQRGVPRVQQSLMLEPQWREGKTLPVLAGAGGR